MAPILGLAPGSAYSSGPSLGALGELGVLRDLRASVYSAASEISASSEKKGRFFSEPSVFLRDLRGTPVGQTRGQKKGAPLGERAFSALDGRAGYGSSAVYHSRFTRRAFITSRRCSLVSFALPSASPHAYSM